MKTKMNRISVLAFFSMTGFSACGGPVDLGEDVVVGDEVVDAQGAALKGDIVENPVGASFSVRGTRYTVRSVRAGLASGKRCHVSISSLKQLVAEDPGSSQPTPTERRRIRTFILKRTETSDRTICAGKGDGCIVVVESGSDE